MPNLLLDTEDFTSGNWTAEEDVIRIADTFPPPVFAGASAGYGDWVQDASATKAGLIKQLVTIPVDSNPYVASLFIAKDAITTRFPSLFLEFPFGSPTISCGLSVNTSTGAVATTGDAPDDSGIVDVDASWWRVWIKKANNGTGDGVRLTFFPAVAASLGGGFDSPTTGTVIAWGANITQSAALQTYIPAPFYVFATPARIIFAKA